MSEKHDHEHLVFILELFAGEDGRSERNADLVTYLNVPLPLEGDKDERNICASSHMTAARTRWLGSEASVKRKDSARLFGGEDEELPFQVIVKGEKVDDLQARISVGNKVLTPDIKLPSRVWEDELDDDDEQVVKLGIEGPEYKTRLYRQKNAECMRQGGCAPQKGSKLLKVAAYVPHLSTTNEPK